jgi:hypothetical protein
MSKKNKKKEKKGDGTFKYVRISRALQYEEDDSNEESDCNYDREHEAKNMGIHELKDNTSADIDGKAIVEWVETATPGDVLITDDYVYLCQGRENVIGRIILTTETKVESKTIQPQ